MKIIKLNRDLWNHKKGDEMEVKDENANWAINKGFSELIEEKEEPKAKERKKKIDPKAEGYKTKASNQ